MIRAPALLALALLTACTPSGDGTDESTAASSSLSASSYAAREREVLESATSIREPCLDHDPLRNAYFGELHVHTSYSMDAFAFDTQELGLAKIAARIIELTGYLHERLDAAGIWLLSTRDPEHLSGITVAAADNPAEVVARLREQGIIVSTRGEGIRVSLHYYNNHDDIDRFVDALASA